ncbi:hypothetical protein BT63DRAFT_451386 [Microthyrium microscopicum]|uniref:RNA helicase HEL117 n=1 Tax=Microthyrium microscopicum TaxID=703497 RepID=A0A6A6UPG9_9PEZI|nr:hypothetical protein BT63DRAFT_451386 [Microthyrium microscopicum]
MPSSRPSARSRSPHSRTAHPSRRSRSPRPSSHKTQKSFPFKVRPLSKHELESFRGLFALYLEAQKQIDINELDEKELKGRWKSFFKKWNQGELAEGWYDPETKRRADEQALDVPPQEENVHEPKAQDSDDEFGPAMPAHVSGGARAGPSIPSLQDLAYRDELVQESHLASREDTRYERKTERKAQKDRMEELVPRADAGTRERQLEKKKETSALHASFRENRSPGAEEIPEGDLMGDDGIANYKRKKMEEEKKKSERQLRKEEIWRAKAEERREILEVRKEKEDRTMDMLKELARQRYG